MPKKIKYAVRTYRAGVVHSTPFYTLAEAFCFVRQLLAAGELVVELHVN